MDRDGHNYAFPPFGRADAEPVIVAPDMLKSCDLCGALNLDVNPECFVCGWGGHFDRDMTRIEHGLSRLRTSGRELWAYHFTDLRMMQRIRRRLTLWSRLCTYLRGLFRL